jgi:hypothetical protein
LIKAVLFDIGNTLVKYNYDDPEEVFRKVLFPLGISRSLNDIKKAFMNAEKEAEETNLRPLSGKIKCEDFSTSHKTCLIKHNFLEDGEDEPK